MKLIRLALPLICLITVLVGCAPKPASDASAPPVLPAQTSAQSASPAPAPGLTGTLRVGVPCGLAMAYKEVRTLFLQQNPGVKIVDHVSNIGPMTRAVRDGKANLDVFLSLGQLEIKSLVKAGRVQGQPTPYLRQAMQLLVQKGNPLGIKRLEDLSGPKVQTVVLCVPQLTLGHAADEALKSVGLLDKLEAEGKIIRIDQPMQAKELIFKRKADATFIYSACSNPSWKTGDPEHTTIGKADVVMTVPETAYGGMKAVAAVLKTAKNPTLAQQFISFMLTPGAQEAITKWGYRKVNEPLAGQPAKH